MAQLNNKQFIGLPTNELTPTSMPTPTSRPIQYPVPTPSIPQYTKRKLPNGKKVKYKWNDVHDRYEEEKHPVEIFAKILIIVIAIIVLGYWIYNTMVI